MSSASLSPGRSWVRGLRLLRPRRRRLLLPPPLRRLLSFRESPRELSFDPFLDEASLPESFDDFSAAGAFFFFGASLLASGVSGTSPPNLTGRILGA